MAFIIFIVLTDCLLKVGTLMRMILSDPAKSGLEGGAWIDGYDLIYQNKDKNIIITNNKSPLFFPCSLSANPM